MTITLAEARARVRKLTDDADEDLDATTEVDPALKVAFAAVYEHVVRASPRRFALEASISSSAAGVVDLSTLSPAPHRVLGVALTSGGYRYPVEQAPQASGGYADDAQVRTLLVLHVPALTFPAAEADAFVWGQSGVDLPLLDELLCLHAAAHANVRDDEENRALDRRIEATEAALQRMLDLDGWTSMPLIASRSAGDPGLAYILRTSTTLQLVR